MKRRKKTETEEIFNPNEEREDLSLGSEVTKEEQFRTRYLNLDTQQQAAKKLEGDDAILQLEAQGVNMKTKSSSSWKQLAESKDFAELVSQTKEIVASSLYSPEDMQKIESDNLDRQEKLELLEKNYENLNAKPLSGVDSYDSYALVLNKSNWNYAEIIQRNTNFTLVDLAIQTHLYLYNGTIISIEKIKTILEKFVDVVANQIMSGYAVLLNPVIVLDTVRFDKSNVLPICIANPKLMSPLNIIEWDALLSSENQEHLMIVDAFIVLIENALVNGHEVEFFQKTLLVRNATGITSLFISEEAAKYFKSKFSPKYVELVHDASVSKK